MLVVRIVFLQSLIHSVVRNFNSSHIKALNGEQCQAHDIVIQNLDTFLNNQNPPQLLMQTIGTGGTGKTKLLNAITTSFEQRGVPHLFAKTAMFGVAR